MRIIPDILPPEEVSILAGASGAGKTALIMQMIAAIQQSKPFLGYDPPSSAVSIGYIGADRSWSSAKQWAEVTGVDLTKLKSRSLVNDESIDLDKLDTKPLRLLFDVISSLSPVDLVVVDPMIIFLGGDTKAYNPNATKLIRINRWCMHNHFTLLGTHHAAKARTDYGYSRPQDRISGTSAFLGYTSTQLFLDTPQETGEECYNFHVVAHNAPAVELNLVRDNHGKFERINSGEAATLEDAILNLFHGFDFRVYSDIAAAFSDVPERTLKRHMASLVDSGKLTRISKGIYRPASVM